MKGPEIELEMYSTATRISRNIHGPIIQSDYKLLVATMKEWLQVESSGFLILVEN